MLQLNSLVVIDLFSHVCSLACKCRDNESASWRHGGFCWGGLDLMYWAMFYVGALRAVRWCVHVEVRGIDCRFLPRPQLAENGFSVLPTPTYLPIIALAMATDVDSSETILWSFIHLVLQIETCCGELLQRRVGHSGGGLVSSFAKGSDPIRQVKATEHQRNHRAYSLLTQTLRWRRCIRRFRIARGTWAIWGS